MNGASLTAVSAWQAAWLLTRLRLRRQWNIIRTIYRFRKRSTARTATAPKGGSVLGILLTAFVVLSMIGNCANLSHQVLRNMNKTLGTAEVYKEVKRSWIGVQLGNVTAEKAKALRIGPARGALVTGLFDKGPAWATGLRAGDVIIVFDNTLIITVADLQRIVSVTPAGKSIDLVYIRDGQDHRASITPAVLPEDAKPIARPIAPAPGSVLAPSVLRGAAFVAALLLLATICFSLSSREIAKPEWDLEWLATLPLPLPTLLASRLVERSITNPAGIILFGPFLTIAALYCGYRWTAPLIGLGLALLLLIVVATAQTLVDTGLRVAWSPSRLRNLQAVVSLLGMLPLAFVLAMALRDNSFVFGWIATLPDWLAFLPGGLAVRALAATDVTSVLTSVGLLLVEIIVFVAVAVVILQRQLRNGVVAAGAREAGARVPVKARPTNVTRGTWFAWLSPIQWREVRLLGRDRNYMSQTMVLPIVMVGAQIFIYATSNVFVGAVDHPANLAAIAFGLATYTLMLSAFQTLNAEGQALWILFSVPYSLESVLRQKAKLWAVVATIYPIIVFAIAAGLAGRVSPHFVGTAAIVVLGVPIFATIATALGVFACNPLAQDVQRRVRPTYTYLYLLLVSLYGYSLYASKIWQQGAMIVLTALLAIALWQKARDRFDYLLDPTASPPARVSVADGLIAALMFFVVQALVLAFFQSFESGLAIGTTVWIAFCTAGVVTYTTMRLTYRWTKTQGVPRILGADLKRALLWGLGGGLAAALIGLIYIEIIASMGVLPSLRQAAAGNDTMIWLPPLAIIGAPLFEEFIFRGLIFGGLRRSLGLAFATLASAAIFAIVHPPLSIVPVFFVGIATALVYERTKMLAAPMLVHAIFNAAVIGFQWNFMQ